jgi:dynein heavy chain, axonemal
LLPLISYLDRRAITEFFEGNTSRVVFFYPNSKDEMIADRAPPPTLKKKCIYLLKNANATKDFAESYSVGELSTSALEQLLTVSRDVCYPLLSNPKNQRGWPDVVAKEVTESMHSLLSNLYVIIGEVQVRPPTRNRPL